MKNSARSFAKDKIRFKIGFTIVELLIFFGLTTIFLTVLTDLFVSIFDVKRESEATSAVEQDGRYIMSRLVYDVSRSSAVTTPDSLGSSASSLVLTIGGSSSAYAVSSGVLNLTDSGGTYRINSSETSVSNLTFQRLGDAITNETVRVTFTVSSTTQRNSGSEVRTLQTTIGRR